MLQLPQLAKPFRNVYLVNVSPEQAEAWLANNNYNRNFDQKEVDKYIRLLKSGKWRRTHQGIAFDRNGMLIDGQHRLHAIVQSGMTVSVLVFIDEDPENHEAIDCGKKRTPLDAMKLELRDSRITSKHIATLRAMVSGRFCVRKLWTNAELIALYHTHGKSVQFVMDEFASIKDKSLNDTTVRGVIARAYYRVPGKALVEFCDILRSGHGDHISTDCVRELRWWLHGVEDQREGTRREIYNRTQYTLMAFLAQQTKAKVPTYPSELFPLTEK